MYTEFLDLRNQQDELKERQSAVDKQYRSNIYSSVGRFVENHLPEYVESQADSISRGQFSSKLWLVEELKKIEFSEQLHIEIVGGWFGFPLIEMLSEFLDIKQIDVYDLDPNCSKVMAQYINHFEFSFRIVSFGDYFERTELRRRHLIINTSSEHMKDIHCMQSRYKNKPVVAIQSNDYYEIEDHTNCVEDIEELEFNSRFANLLYKGANPLPKYNRFMTIGSW